MIETELVACEFFRIDFGFGNAIIVPMTTRVEQNPSGDILISEIDRLRLDLKTTLRRLPQFHTALAETFLDNHHDYSEGTHIEFSTSFNLGESQYFIGSTRPLSGEPTFIVRVKEPDNECRTFGLGTKGIHYSYFGVEKFKGSFELIDVKAAPKIEEEIAKIKKYIPSSR